MKKLALDGPAASDLPAAPPCGDPGHFQFHDGFWQGPQATLPCVRKTAYRRRDGVLLARLRAEARTLALLAKVAGVPKLLQLDESAGVLVRTHAPGAPLDEVPPGLLRQPPRAIRLALVLTDILGGVH